MKKYKVTIPYLCWVKATVEAESEDEAIGATIEDGQIDHYVANGGTDKLIGVYRENVYICANEAPYEEHGHEIEVEEIQ